MRLARSMSSKVCIVQVYTLGNHSGFLNSFVCFACSYCYHYRHWFYACYDYYDYDYHQTIRSLFASFLLFHYSLEDFFAYTMLSYVDRLLVPAPPPGEGVVGQTPILSPARPSFQYQSSSGPLLVPGCMTYVSFKCHSLCIHLLIIPSIAFLFPR